jgi:hypothetical protein
MLKLSTYNIYQGGELPPFAPNRLYEYWLAGAGVYLRAKRTGLEVVMPIAWCEVRGLASLAPYLKLDYPPVPLTMVNQMLEFSRRAKDAQGQPLEQLFHLSLSLSLSLSYDARIGAGGWRLEIPPQQRTAHSVKPLASGAGSSYERAILELHSHHVLSAYFSTADDRDEARSFRLFAVIGHIFDKPEIRLRVGVFGYFWQIPARFVFEIPEWLHDCNTTDQAEMVNTEHFMGGDDRLE